MVIEGSFYRLTPINDSAPRFDLELLREIGGKNPRSEFKIEGYGFLLEKAIEHIIHFAVRSKFKDEVVDLKTYLEEYRKEKDIIKAEIEK